MLHRVIPGEYYGCWWFELISLSETAALRERCACHGEKCNVSSFFGFVAE
jgi:hypothetical protein